MSKKIQTDYPDLICHDCGSKWSQYVKKPGVHVCTSYMGTCDMCGENTTVTEPRDYQIEIVYYIEYTKKLNGIYKNKDKYQFQGPILILGKNKVLSLNISSYDPGCHIIRRATKEEAQLYFTSRKLNEI